MKISIRLLVCASIFTILLTASPFVVSAQWATSTTNIYNTNTGNVGIGTTAPTQKLQIGDNTGSSIGIRIAPVGVNWDMLSDSSGNFNIANGNGNYLTFIKTSLVSSFSGNVGIGTNTPTDAQLVVSGGGTYLGEFTNGTRTVDILAGSGISAVGTKDSQIRFYTGDVSTNGIAINSGNIGIGTTTPSQKLEVAGNIKLSGSIISDGDICIGVCP